MKKILLATIPYWGPLLPECPATGCTFCNLAQLAQNLINFLITLSLTLAVGFITYGGIMMIIFSAQPPKIETSKKIISSAIIGLVVVLGSWIIVNTFLHILVGHAAWPWYVISC